MNRFIRQSIKKSLGIAFRGMTSVQRRLDCGLTAFVYHEISNNPSQFALQYDLAVTPDIFKDQIYWISKNFNVIHPTKLLCDTELPSRAAIITFDDGFLGAFQNGLPILAEFKLPCIIFLNMIAVSSRYPSLSAKSCFLERFDPDYESFCKSHGLLPPYYLSITPNLMAQFQGEHHKSTIEDILKYQGVFVNPEVLDCWDKTGLVAYGNHLYDHWNTLALSEAEIELQYYKNVEALRKFQSYVELFAFTNGQPGLCFQDKNVRQVAKLGAVRLFSAQGGVNTDHKALLLSRMSLSNRDDDSDQLWFRVGRAAIASKALSA